MHLQILRFNSLDVKNIFSVNKILEKSLLRSSQYAQTHLRVVEAVEESRKASAGRGRRGRRGSAPRPAPRARQIARARAARPLVAAKRLWK